MLLIRIGINGKASIYNNICNISNAHQLKSMIMIVIKISLIYDMLLNYTIWL